MEKLDWFWYTPHFIGNILMRFADMTWGNSYIYRPVSQMDMGQPSKTNAKAKAILFMSGMFHQGFYPQHATQLGTISSLTKWYICLHRRIIMNVCYWKHTCYNLNQFRYLWMYIFSLDATGGAWCHRLQVPAHQRPPAPMGPTRSLSPVAHVILEAPGEQEIRPTNRYIFHFTDQIRYHDDYDDCYIIINDNDYDYDALWSMML